MVIIVSNIVPAPDGLTFRQWLNWTTDILELDSVVVTDEEPWQNGAAKLLENSYFTNKLIIGYNNTAHWQEWAESLLYATESTQ